MLPKLLLICILISSFIFTTHSYNNKCLRHQETLLLQLRDELIFNSSVSTKLVRWNESGECCKWHGVECDASGYVVSLQLVDEGISGGIGDSSSLFRFKYLQKLNLAYNDFNYTDPIPKGFDNFTYLTHLNLSHARFGGQVPVEISSLKRLVSLDISNYYCWTPRQCLSLEYPNLEMLVQNLTGLRELYLDCVNITSFHERKKWSHIISSYLPNLTSLSLSYCNLYGPLSKSFWKLHSLSILRLDDNDLSAISLHELFTNFPSLTTLTLSDCLLKGSIPSTFANLTKLIYVDLAYNSLTGSLPSTLFATLTELIHVDLSDNSLTGSLPSTLFANLTELIHVNLSNNSLTGSLPSTLFEGLSNLVHLDLRHNLFFGNIPHSLFALPSLLELDLSYNQFNGTFQLDKFRSLPNLTLLGLSGNSLSVDVGNVNSSSYGGLQLKGLYLGYCNLSNFPDFIKDLDLQELDLSANIIAGEIPSWIWGTQLMHLDLSFNLLTDFQKPYHIPASLGFLSLGSNMTWSTLQILDISSNNFSGRLESINFSSWRGMMQWSNAQSYINGVTLIMKGIELELEKIWPDFGSIDFSCNNFIGEIPNAIGDLTSLYHLNLSHNALNGSIPQSFGNLSKLESLDLSRNQLAGPIPMGLGELTFLEVLNLSYNKLVGTIPKGRQFQTFSVESFEGNPGLCGFPLNTSFSHTDELSSREHEDVEEKKEVEWEYVSAALGYIVGFGSVVWLLIFCRSFRHKYFGKIDEVIEEVFDGRNRRRRRARMAARNRVRRQ